MADHYADAFAGELAYKPLDRALLSLVADDVRAAGRGPLGDLGAGPGHVAAALAPSGTPVVAVDLSPAMAAIARTRFALPAACGSLTALPLATGALGGAVALYCLIHLDDDGILAAAGEIARPTAPTCWPGGPPNCDRKVTFREIVSPFGPSRRCPCWEAGKCGVVWRGSWWSTTTAPRPRRPGP